jgi:hypothetical protein
LNYLKDCQNLPLSHKDDAVRHFAGKAHFMRDKHHGHACTGHLFENLEHFAREFGITELDEIAADPSLAMQTMYTHGGPPTPSAKEGGQFGVSPTQAQQQGSDRASAMAPMVPQM